MIQLVYYTRLSGNVVHFHNKENKSAFYSHRSLPSTVTETSMLSADPILLLAIHL